MNIGARARLNASVGRLVSMQPLSRAHPQRAMIILAGYSFLSIWYSLVGVVAAALLWQVHPAHIYNVLAVIALIVLAIQFLIAIGIASMVRCLMCHKLLLLQSP